MLQVRLPLNWPLTARVPVASGLLIFVVAVAMSHFVMTRVFAEQETGLRRLANVYLDGISTAILPYVVTGDRANTTAALKRALLFVQGVRERRLIVETAQGAPFAHVERPAETPMSSVSGELLKRLDESKGLRVDEKNGIGWVYRELGFEGQTIARIYAELDLTKLQHERHLLRSSLIGLTAFLSITSALLGYLLVQWMLHPVQALTARLRYAQAGHLRKVPESDLPPPTTEFGRLLRNYNLMVEAAREREHLTIQLAEKEKMALLGQLAATLAHEVRNPLGGMFTAVDTGRKFGGDPQARTEAFNLIERGLESIRDVVGATLASYRVPATGRPFSPADIHDLRLLVEPEARRRQVALEWHSTVTAAVPISATEVRQIALNLLLNACAASPRGGRIRFSAELCPSSLKISVDDEGAGLPEPVVAALEDRPSDFGGGGGEQGKLGVPFHGIGVWVVIHLVEALRGRIEARAGQSSRGSCIVVTLPTWTEEANVISDA